MSRDGSKCPGSPPQVRGKPKDIRDKLGIKPDHPRRCGENSWTNCRQKLTKGSPPQVRGKPKYILLFSKKGGITPAGAGKTASSSASVSTAEDHPRRCGENGAAEMPQRTELGSPPQVRGKPVIIQQCRLFLRITPAGAGKTMHSHNTWSGNRDHPRRCGENRISRSDGFFGLGSPPQVRGKREYEHSGRETNRITPAGAGKTGLYR